MPVVHTWGRYPFKNWAAKVARDLTVPGGLTYSATYRPSARYPGAPWLVEGRAGDPAPAHPPMGEAPMRQLRQEEGRDGD